MSEDLSDLEKLNELYDKYWQVHSSMLDASYTPVEIAAVLISQGLCLYKTVLSEEEFEEMMATIVSTTDRIQKLSSDMSFLH